MPFKSKAQAKLFYAATNKKSGLKGLSQKSAKDFIKDTKSRDIKQLPEKVKRKFKVLK